jgi:hypothetical protein
LNSLSALFSWQDGDDCRGIDEHHRIPPSSSKKALSASRPVAGRRHAILERSDPIAERDRLVEPAKLVFQRHADGIDSLWQRR